MAQRRTWLELPYNYFRLLFSCYTVFSVHEAELYARKEPSPNLAPQSHALAKLLDSSLKDGPRGRDEAGRRWMKRAQHSAWHI